MKLESIICPRSEVFTRMSKKGCSKAKIYTRVPGTSKYFEVLRVYFDDKVKYAYRQKEYNFYQVLESSTKTRRNFFRRFFVFFHGCAVIGCCLLPCTDRGHDGTAGRASEHGWRVKQEAETRTYIYRVLSVVLASRGRKRAGLLLPNLQQQYNKTAAASAASSSKEQQQHQQRQYQQRPWEIKYEIWRAGS